MDAFKVLTIIGALIGFAFVLLSFGFEGAPQQAAAAGVALFLVVAPYCVHGVLYRSRKND